MPPFEGTAGPSPELRPLTIESTKLDNSSSLALRIFLTMLSGWIFLSTVFVFLRCCVRMNIFINSINILRLECPTSVGRTDGNSSSYLFQYFLLDAPATLPSGSQLNIATLLNIFSCHPSSCLSSICSRYECPNQRLINLMRNFALGFYHDIP